MKHPFPFLRTVLLGSLVGLSSVQAQQIQGLATANEAKTVAPGMHTSAAANPAIEAGGTPKVTRGTRIEDLRLATGFYTTPAAPFICAPDEVVVRISLGSSTGEEAQARIDAARAKDPAAILLVTIAGKITITKVPLSFGTRTCVFFQSGSQITTALPCSAPALVRIQDGELISLASAASATASTQGVLDGTGAGIIGIQVVNSGKVHLDRLSIRQCRGGGVVVNGRGAVRYADGVSLTRCSISGCDGGGLVVRDSAQFIALDNRITRNSGDGMEIHSASALLANNICAGNRIGIILSARDGTVSRNQIVANATGLRLTSGSADTLVSENALVDNRLGAEILGTNAMVEANYFANEKPVVTGGKGNVLQSNAGLTAADLTTLGCAYFRPPTVNDRHNDAVIWKAPGESPMGRYDLTIASTKDPLSDVELTQRLQAARLANPGKVLVARLNGAFKITTRSGITVPDHTCILLDGRIDNEQAAPCEQMVKLAGKGCASFSGGTLVSRSQVTNGLSAMKGANCLLIDHVGLNLGAPNGRVGTRSINGISLKQHGGSCVIRGCDIRDPGARGVWIHVTGRVYVLSNRFYTGGMTIDFDAFGHHNSALYNTLSGNNYHSAIFLEEGVKFNTVFANHCMDNEVTSIAVHCQEAKGPTANNLIACNLLEYNGKAGGADLGFSGVSADKNSMDNYAFNNRIIHNHGRGAINIKANSTGNYIAQNVIVDCPTMVANWSTKPASKGFVGSTGFTSPPD